MILVAMTQLLHGHCHAFLSCRLLSAACLESFADSTIALLNIYGEDDLRWLLSKNNKKLHAYTHVYMCIFTHDMCTYPQRVGHRHIFYIVNCHVVILLCKSNNKDNSSSFSSRG